MRNRTARALLASVLALAGACGKHSPAKPSALDLGFERGITYGFAVLPAGTYVAYGLSTAAVHDEITVESVTPLRTSNVEAAPAELAFFACKACRRRPGTYGVRRLLGETCGATPPHNVALRPAAGTTLFPGDQVHLVVVGRTVAAAPASMSGARITYRQHGKRHTVTTDIRGLEMRGAMEHGDPPCPNPDREFWFGADEPFAAQLLN